MTTFFSRETAVNFLDRHIVTDMQNAEPIEVGHKSERCFLMLKKFTGTQD
jgi:hypothetical protein